MQLLLVQERNEIIPLVGIHGASHGLGSRNFEGLFGEETHNLFGRFPLVNHTKIFFFSDQFSPRYINEYGSSLDNSNDTKLVSTLQFSVG